MYDPRELLKKPEIRAMLDTIAWAEGADYDIKFGGGKIDSFEKHPGIFTVKTSKGNIKSSVAGRYQFKLSTWNELTKQYDLVDFYPDSQDIGGAALLMRTQKKFKSDVVTPLLAGDLNKAIHVASYTWASFPDVSGASHYPTNNKARSLEDIINKYNYYLSLYE